jgi:NAD(P)-dependent dehydrogenase (short-subunit alcohol dehydrogenase family)
MSTRIVLVTGANRGIGREVARRLAIRGETVIVTARDVSTAAQTADEIGGSSVAMRLDVTEAASIAAAASELDARFGRLDGLVNNAAIPYDTWQRGVDADLDVVREAFETNFFGVWRTTTAMLPLLRRSDRGRVVNVSSESGSIAGMGGGTPAYSTSKAALNALTRILAAELASARILVNAVCPGWVATDMGGPGGRPVADGAASVIWGLDLADDGPSGGFYRDGRPLCW